MSSAPADKVSDTDLPSRSVQLCRSKEAQRVSQQGQLTALVAVRPDSSG